MDVSLDVIELLMNLSANSYTTSSKIRENYSNEEYKKLNYLLSNLIKKGYIKKRRLQDLKPGGDKLEYMLDKNGSKHRENVIQRSIKILTSNKEISKIILKRLLTNDTDVVANIVTEVSEELSEYLDAKTPTKIQKRITSIINKHLFQ